MNGKLIYINENNKEYFKDSFINFNLSNEDKEEIKLFEIDLDKTIMKIIYEQTEELYLIVNENEEIQIIFGMKINEDKGRPFILKLEGLEIKKDKVFLFRLSKYYLLKVFKPMVKELEVYKPTKVLNIVVDNFLSRLGFKIEEELYKIKENYFIKYKQ